MKLAKFSSLLLITFFLNKIAHAEKYFGFDSMSPYVIDKPFEINSQEHQDQIKQIISIQKNIEIEDIDKALHEKQLRPETVVEEVLESVTRDKFPQLYSMLDRVGDTSREITNGIKDHWKIVRPYKFDKNVQLMITPSKGFCYPSGHTTGAYIYAYVMGILVPNKSQEFQDYANEIAWHRVQVGMHYPQDLQGGKQLATFLMGGLMQNQEFRDDFKKAQEELKKAEIVK